MATRKHKKEISPEPITTTGKPVFVARYGAFVDDIRSDRGLWFIIYFAVLLAYLLLNQGGSIDLFKSPQWAFRAFAFAGLIIFGLLDPSRVLAGLRTVNFRGVLPVSLGLMIIFSNIVSHRRFETLEETMNILAYFSLAFLCYIYINNLQKLRQLVEIIVAAGFLIAFHGLYIFYGALWSRGETTPLSSLFYWHNPCAGFLLLIWPVMLAQFYSLRRGWHIFLILYIFFFTFTAFGLTLSRGGWLSGLIPFFLIPFVLSRKEIIVGWRGPALFLAYFLSAIPFVLRKPGQFLQPIVDRWNQMRPDDYSVVGRLEFWKIAWNVFLDHPLVGIGFNTFGYYYVHYQTDPQYFTKDTHNLYLRFLVEGGIIGAVVIITVLILVLKLAFRILREQPGRMLTVYRVGLMAGILGELAHMALDFDETFPVIPMLLICQVAVVARTFKFSKVEQNLTISEWDPPLLKEQSEDDDPIYAEAKPGWFLKIKPIWIVMALVLFVVNILGYASMKYYEIGKDLVYNRTTHAQTRAEDQMSQLEKEAVRSQTQELPTFDDLLRDAWADVGSEGKHYWELSLKLNPYNWYSLNDLVNGYYYQAIRLQEAGMKDELNQALNEGLAYGTRLLKITPWRAASQYYVGQLEIMSGRLNEDADLENQGLSKLLKSVELDPMNIPQYFLGIAQYYFDEGNYQESMKYIDSMEGKFVPRYDTGDFDFDGLKGKSHARLDWRTLTQTMRDAWALKASILIKWDRKKDALVPMNNALATPLGAGEVEEALAVVALTDRQIEDIMMEVGRQDEEKARETASEKKKELYYLKTQLPFVLIIADISAQLGDWVAADTRARQAISITSQLGLEGTPESKKAYDIRYEAEKHLKESDQTE